MQHAALALLLICNALLLLYSVELCLVIALWQRLVARTARTEHDVHQAAQYTVVLAQLRHVHLADKSQQAAVAAAEAVPGEEAKRLCWAIPTE